MNIGRYFIGLIFAKLLHISKVVVVAEKLRQYFIHFFFYLSNHLFIAVDIGNVVANCFIVYSVFAEMSSVLLNVLI